MRYSSILKYLLFGFYFLMLPAMAIEKSSLSYTDLGQGKPLVLIHAFPTDQRLWLPQQNGLKANFRVITLDLLGFGQAAAVDGQAVTMTQYANEIKELLDQLHIKKAIIGGESMGGYVALAFLSQYPDYVDGVILSDTQSIPDSDAAKTKRETTAVDILQNGTSQFIQNFLPKALTANANPQDKEFLEAMMKSQTPAGMASALRGMALREDTSSTLANTTLPVLILTGEQDVVISPEQSQQMHRLAKNSKLVVIPNAGHLSNLEQSDVWNKAVIEMFSK